MENCIFCRIAAQEIKSELIYEDEQVVAFADINPRAPVHILIIPRKHIPSLAETGPEDEALLGRINIVATQLAHKLGIAESGYRLLSNCGKNSGQEVAHLHFHLIGGHFLGAFTQE